MTCLPISKTLFGCLLLSLNFQGFLFRHQHPSPNCNSLDCPISCMFINLEYVHCNWTRPQTQDKNYIFSTAQSKDKYENCPEYIQDHGQNVACKIPFGKDDRFKPFYTRLNIGGNQSVTKDYKFLGEIVKLNPPFNLSVVWSTTNELCLHWVNSIDWNNCVNNIVRYRRSDDEKWMILSGEYLNSFCIPFASTVVVYTFQVRSNLKDKCMSSSFSSEWSEPIQWGNSTVSITEPPSQEWWQVLIFIFAFILLLAFVLLLIYCERIKVVLLPVVPDPRKNLQDLFHNHNGNVESWIYISRELKEAFEPEYTETPCVVCEPSTTVEAESSDGPVEQPSS